MKKVKDFKSLKQTCMKSGEVKDINMPETANVIQWFTEDGTKVSVRPSGTEPKIKFYIEVKGDMKDASEYKKACDVANTKVEAIKKSLNL